MIEKIKRIARRTKKSVKFLFTLWLPAILLLIFIAFIAFSVKTSGNGAFRPCTAELKECLIPDGDSDNVIKKVGRITACSYRTAWCDARVLWLRLNGKDYLPAEFLMPGSPPVDEKAEAELFKKMTEPENLKQRFEEFDALPPAETQVKGTVDEMEDARRERILFEQMQNEIRRRLLEQQEKTGQSAQ